MCVNVGDVTKNSIATKRVERKGYTNGVARVRSLKPSRGNAKHVTVLKESARSEIRRVHKACPCAV